MLSEEIKKLMPHSYLTKCLAKCLKKKKEILGKEYCVALLDFAEGSIVQDKVAIGARVNFASSSLF